MDEGDSDTSALAYTAPKRSPPLPDVPSAGEAGVPDNWVAAAFRQDTCAHCTTPWQTVRPGRRRRRRSSQESTHSRTDQSMMKFVDDTMSASEKSSASPTSVSTHGTYNTTPRSCKRCLT